MSLNTLTLNQAWSMSLSDAWGLPIVASSANGIATYLFPGLGLGLID